MARVNIGGEPGDTYTNDTGKVLYQFFADWVRTCGICAQYDSMIGSSWPIPIHRLCRCRQVAIWPGKTSRPFTDFREKIANLDPGQRAKVVGVANLQLIDAGVVKWEDVVTGQRVRDLREVVASKKLTVDRMTGAGVTRSVAERAYATVNTPAHELADQQRKELLQKVLDKGVTKEQLKQALGQRLAARVGITGPGGAASMPVTPKAPKVPRVPRKKAPELVTIATRADYLKKAKVKEDVADRIAREEAAATARLKAEEAARLAAEGAARVKAEAAAKERAAAEAARLKARAAEAKARVAALEAKKAADLAAKSGAKAPGTLDRETLEERLKGLESAKPSEKNAAIQALVRERQSTGAKTYASAGMSAPETFRTIEFEGVRYHFHEVTGASGEVPPIVSMLRSLAAMAPPPRGITRHTTDIYLASQANAADAYWAEQYHMPGAVSAASGGINREITVYNSKPVSVGTLAHEMGHNLATAAFGGTAPAPDSPFHRAWTSKEQPWTAYAKNSIDEDFAESVLEYVQQPGVMKTFRPLRYQAIEELVRQSDAGKF
jgi:hypothetical protein